MIDNEMALLGCVMLDNQIISDLFDDLKPEMFSDSECAFTYQQMISLYDDGLPINVPELIRVLQQKENDTQKIGEFIKEFATMPTTSTEYKSHAKLIKQSYKVRELHKLIDKQSYIPNEIDKDLGELADGIQILMTDCEKDNFTYAELDELYKDDYFKQHTEKPILTGLNNIDTIIGGLEGGDLIVIGARPSVGKSAFALQILQNMAKDGFKVGYFNLEMSKKQVYERLVSRNTSISISRLKNAVHLRDDEKERYDKRLFQGADNLKVISGSNSVSQIRMKCKKQRFDVVCIDYLQLIKADRTFGNRASEVGEISKSIKRLAMEMNIPIIALSQMNRNNDDLKEPTLTDLRESGDIEQDASIIGLMWNATESKEFKGFKIDKNRQGCLGKTGLRFRGAMMNFEECELNLSEKKDKKTTFTPFD